MKIAILSWTFYPSLGGTQVFLYKLIEGLTNKGNSVDIYLPSYCYEQSKKYAPKGSKIIKLSKYENFFLKYFPYFLKYQIYRIQKKNNYDIWQVIGAYPSSYLCESIK